MKASIPVSGGSSGEGPDDDVLAERMRAGDRDAFVTLTSRYWDVVHRIARNMLPDPAKASEVAEETFLRALRSPDWFPREVAFQVSLYRLGIILSLIQHQRAEAPDAGWLLPQHDAKGRLVVPEEGLRELDGRPDLVDRFREALEHLDDLDRAALVLRVVEEVPLEVAAAILRVSPQEIRDRTHRACLGLTGFFLRLSGGARAEERRWKTSA